MGKRIERDSETSPYLPEELIQEILYYCPLKHLFRLKCVSKSWHSLISSKSFIKEHVKKSNTLVDLARHKLMLSFDKSQKRYGPSRRSIRKPNCIVSCSLWDILEDSTVIALDDNHMRKFGYDIEIERVEIQGSCNGLILVLVNLSINLFLWNPFIGKMKYIPYGPLVGSLSDSIYGLGYDERGDDYKVVRISKVKPCHTHIYSCKTNSWKKIEDFDKGNSLLDHPGKFVSGRLHWLAVQDNHDREIVSLDMMKERYEIVALPEDYSKRVLPVLKDCGGCLCLVSFSNGLEDISAWVMKEYGVRESWTKIWTFSDFADPRKQINQVTTLCLHKNGDVAVAFGSYLLVVYRGKNMWCRWRVEMLDLMIDCVVYVESLVWPFGDEELGI